MQKDYRISTDGFGGLADIDKLKHINITFYCVGEGEFEYAVRGKADIENEIAFVHAKRLTTRTQRISGHKAGSRYFCESLFWASQPKQAAKT